MKKPNEEKSPEKNFKSHNSRRKGKPNSRKPKEDVAAEGYATTKGSNAIAWHTPDVELLKRAADMSWAFQTGELIGMGSPMYGPMTYTAPKGAQAGILVIRDQLSVGGAGYVTPTTKENNYSLPTYDAANTLLTEMRSRSRIRNTYDAPDVFMLSMAMANIYAAIIFAKRLAGTVRMFTYKNQYLPEHLIKCQGFDPAWFKANQYRFVTELNVLISEVNKIYVPNRMHLFELINERFSQYYTEGDDIKDQLYVITPAFLNILVTTGANWTSEVKPAMCIPGKILNWGSAGTGLVTQYDASSLYTGDQLLNVIRRMIENVLTEGTTPDITGDMANCFGESDRFYLPMADPMAIATPVFDEEILETIHNMSWSAAVQGEYYNFNNGAGTEIEGFKIVQDPNDNRIGSYDCFTRVGEGGLQKFYESESAHRIIDVHKDPNAEKTFAITRLRNITGMRTVSGSDIYVQMKFSTDLICSVEIVSIYDNAGVPDAKVTKLYLLNGENMSNLTQLAVCYPFHYCPMMRVFDTTTYELTSDWVIGGTDIWAILSNAQDIVNMNRISLLTLLGAYNNV